MYCSRCGKKVLDSMLFCPFCGTKLVVPDQASGAEAKRTVEPLDATEEAREIVSAEPPVASFEATPRRKSETLFKPPTEPEEEKLDMFLEGDAEDSGDDFDAFVAEQDRERPARRRRRRDEDPADDDEESFFARHIRSIVGILLFVALIAALALYAVSDPGQRMLARLDYPLPLKADVYKRLGYESYQAGEYAQAGAFYERALAREPDSYDYASSAAMSFVAAKDTERAAEMLKKCVELKPEAVEAYVYLLNLYPDPNSRSWEITRLLEQGYRKTGDERLKP